MAYRYDPYVAPNTGSIAELMARQGDIQAAGAARIADANVRAAEIGGQAWAGAARDIGRDVQGAAQQVQQQRLDAPRREMEGLQVTAAKQAANDDALFRHALTLAGPDGDLAPAAKWLQAQGGVGIGALQKLTGLVKQQQDQHDEAAGSIGYQIHAGGNTPDAVNRVMDDAVKSGALKPEEADQFRTMASSDPTKIAAASKALMARSASFRAYLDKTVVLPGAPRPGASPSTLVDADGNTVASGAPAGPEPVKTREVTTIGPDGKPSVQIVPDTPGQSFPAPEKKSLQRGSVLLDGKPAEVLIDPDPTAAQKVFDLEGKPIANAATRVKPIPAASTIVNPAALSDVKETVAGMKDGSLPPMMPGRATKEYLATMAEAHRQGYDLAAAVTDWQATQKHIATMNGAQQLRLNQSINSLPEMLDKVDALAGQWKGGRFPILNKANLALAKNGVYGPEVASVATQLDAQIADVTADLGNVYMGGNSPTDHALGLAAKSLSGDWSQKVLHDMTDLARNNVQIRSNSIKHTGVAGASDTNPYGNQPPDASAMRTKAAGVLQQNGHASDAAAIDQFLKNNPGFK